MELFTMRCPNCGASLEVENGIDTLFCKYCGTRIMISGQDKHVLRAKTVAHIFDKIQQIDENDRKYYEEHREEIEERKRIEDHRNTVRVLIPIGVILAIGILCMFIIKFL